MEALGRISSDLSSDTDPALLEKVAEYFISNHNYERAVDILATAQKVFLTFSLII